MFALRGENDLGIGDLGALREFIDWIAEIGFTLVQLLPINETGADNSPYNAISAIAIEPTTLHLAPGSPEDLTRNDFADSLSEIDLAGLRRGRVKYRQVKELKQRILEKAFANFSARADEKRQSEFERFCEDESSWLRDYALFRVLIEQNNGSAAWDQWPQQHRTIESARNWLRDLPLEKQSALTRRLDFFCYVQWIAQQQWRDIKAHAEQRGVALMGDIPFGVSYYSADVFSRTDEFLLDWFGGAPPEPHFKDDAFTQKWGQNWGIPLYRWSAMRANNFQWWRERVRGYPTDLSSVPDRSRPGILSRLCFSVAAREEQRIPAARSTSDARTNWRARAAFRSTERRHTRTPRSEQARRRRMPAHHHGRSWRRARGRGRSRRGARLRAAEFAIAWHRGIQNSAMGNPRWNDHSRRQIRAAIGGDLRNARSPANSRFVGRSACPIRDRPRALRACRRRSSAPSP